MVEQGIMQQPQIPVKTHAFAVRNRISMDADEATHDPTTRCCPALHVLTQGR
jgi:hypothetical protein